MNATPCHVNIQQAKNNLSKLLARAHAGEEITICKAGKPYAKLIAIEHSAQRELGFLRDSFTEEELAALEEALTESMSEDTLALWYDAPVIQTAQLADRDPGEGDAEQ